VESIASGSCAVEIASAARIVANRVIAEHGDSALKELTLEYYAMQRRIEFEQLSLEICQEAIGQLPHCKQAIIERANGA